jgi:hypothetical protein
LADLNQLKLLVLFSGQGEFGKSEVFAVCQNIFITFPFKADIFKNGFSFNVRGNCKLKLVLTFEIHILAAKDFSFVLSNSINLSDIEFAVGDTAYDKLTEKRFVDK